MPHDKKGRKINVGDIIIAKPYNQGITEDEIREYIGEVVDMHSDTQSCTGQMRYFAVNKSSCTEMQIMKDYFGAEDATLIMRSNGDLPE